jgi:hypothetical protein
MFEWIRKHFRRNTERSEAAASEQPTSEPATGQSFDLVSFNRWFSGDVSYHGQGTAEFSSPRALALGPTIVRFDTRGSASIEMDVQSFETEYEARFGDMEVFDPNGRRGNAFVRTSHRLSNPCVSLEIDTEDGKFVAYQPIQYGYSIEDQNVTKLSFDIRSGGFVRRDMGAGVYWALPLINFTFGFRETRPEIREHPLRIWRPAPIPQELSQEEIERFRLFAALRPRLIGFNFQERAAFVEPVPEYSEVVTRLENDDERWGITAVMVGYIGNNSTAQDALREWFPYYLLPVLELLSGREIGCPWIEWRSANGELVGRTHLCVRCPPFESGFAAFRAGSEDYAGLLLTEAQQSSHVREPWLAGVVRNLIRSANSDLVEMRAAFVSLAIDGLCEQFEVSSQNLSASLDQATRDQVREILRDAGGRLRALATAHSDAAQTEILRQIAGRSAGMDQKDRAFGLAVLELLRRFSLQHDGEIAETYYAAQRVNPSSPSSWAAALSHWRGIALHGSYFDFQSGDYDLELIISTCFHLHDVAFRIVLSLLGYTGKYQPAVSLMPDPQPLDWVKANTPASDLGYEKGYRIQ